MDEETMKLLQAEIDQARIEAGSQNLARQQQDVLMEQENKSMIKEQLDLTEEITRIDYLIKGYSLEPNTQGELQWVAPTDQSMVIFSPYGVHLILNTISWYLNKNLLLSNYEDTVIKRKMLNFTNDLIDTVFMEYDKVFQQPTVADCIKVLKERIERRVEISVFAKEMGGHNVDRKEIEKEKLLELENRIENELEKIKQQIIKSRLKRFVLIVRVIQDSVHNTYMRAWKGQERSTLRQHTHISEVRNPTSLSTKPQGGMFPWSKK